MAAKHSFCQCNTVQKNKNPDSLTAFSAIIFICAKKLMFKPIAFLLHYIDANYISGGSTQMPEIMVSLSKTTSHLPQWYYEQNYGFSWKFNCCYMYYIVE